MHTTKQKIVRHVNVCMLVYILCVHLSWDNVQPVVATTKNKKKSTHCCVMYAFPTFFFVTGMFIVCTPPQVWY